MIKVITKKGCQPCRITKKFLQDNKIEYDEEILESDEDFARVRDQYGFSQVPIVLTEDDSWSGLNADKLKKLVK